MGEKSEKPQKSGKSEKKQAGKSENLPPKKSGARKPKAKTEPQAQAAKTKAKSQRQTQTTTKVPVPALTPQEPYALVAVNKISTDLAQSVRFFKDSRDEAAEMVESIQRDGVIAPLVLDSTMEDGRYVLLSGSRRLRYAKSAGMAVVPCVLRATKGKDDQLRLAWEGNRQKKPTAVERAKFFALLREMNDWQGERNTAKVAEFLGVSPATVTQHEKLNLLTEDQQRLVHNRILGSQAGMDIADIVKELGPEKAEKVLRRAAEIEAEAREEREEKVGKAAAKGKGKSGSTKSRTSKPSRPEKPAQVSQRSVRKAARELGAKVDKAKTIGECVELFEVFAQDSANEGLARLGKALVAWQRGKVGDVDLMEVVKDIFPQEEGEEKGGKGKEKAPVGDE